MQLGFLLMTKNVNAYGFVATSAYGIGNKINSIITMPANGIGSAISTIVGQNMGARQQDRADKAYHYALRMGALFLLFFGLILSRRFAGLKLDKSIIAPPYLLLDFFYL